MDRTLLRNQLPALIGGHLPRNARNFSYRIYDGQTRVSALGIPIDPEPFQGTVITKTDEALIIKTGRISFAAVDRQLATLDPEPGTKVQVVPYARRNFEGVRLDAPKQETQVIEGRSYTISTCTLGRSTVKLPLPAPRCPELADLIQQLEALPAPDGYRTISILLVDARARDFSSIDPDPESGNIIATPPAVIFHVVTDKFSGQAAVIYDRGLDLYVVELRRNGDVVERIEQVDFSSLGRTLEELIDDGNWRRIQVTALEKKTKPTLH